jgi:hypothetical protein
VIMSFLFLRKKLLSTEVTGKGSVYLDVSCTGAGNTGSAPSRVNGWPPLQASPEGLFLCCMGPPLGITVASHRLHSGRVS